MPSKWHNLRGQLPAFEQEPTWQQQIDLVKAELAGQTRLQLCGELHDLDLEKKELEVAVKLNNTRREAVNQMLVPTLEDTGETKFTNAYGTFYLKDEPYSQVADKVVYLGYIREKGMEELLSVPYPSTNALVKTLLEAGEQPPPGLKVFLKTTVGRRSA